MTYCIRNRKKPAVVLSSPFRYLLNWKPNQANAATFRGACNFSVLFFNWCRFPADFGKTLFKFLPNPLHIFILHNIKIYSRIESAVQDIPWIVTDMAQSKFLYIFTAKQPKRCHIIWEKFAFIFCNFNKEQNKAF